MSVPVHDAQRDKTRSGLSSGVVVIRSDIEGDSLIASRAALKYGRWLAVPCLARTDRGNVEPKTRANRILTEGTTAERLDLLATDEASRLDDVIVLRGRDDYRKCIEADARRPASRVLAP